MDPDPVTGHWPHWVEVNNNDNSDRYFVDGYKNSVFTDDGTYELIGPKVNGNPHNMSEHRLVKHGRTVLEVERTFDGVKKYLEEHEIEGIVFWLDGEPVCKIKRSDFGLKWPVKGGK